MTRAALLGLAAGCAAEAGNDGPRLLDEVWWAPADTGVGFHDAGRAVNGVRGVGPYQGSLDVFSIGEGLVLGTSAPVFDGDGPELAVFENPFLVASGGVFVEALVVEVSPDGEGFAAFPHALDGDPTDPAAWRGFGGVTPVLRNDETNPVPPLSDGAGGDRFDLADLDPADPVADRVLEEGFVAVRLSPATAWTDPATGAPFPSLPSADGPDIDGVWVR